ncbi:MAG: TerB family tellurite resistance protein [Bdellovibrionales bacterium]|nr:TerB family tellurite resistance protein [Bdellovibrionales bacterium]
MNNKDAEQLMMALIGTYVWVASADGNADLHEYKKFYQVILESPFATHFSELNLRHVYKDTVNMFIDNYDKAMQLTLERIRAVKQNPNIAEEVLRMARAAVIADNNVEASEESVLKIIEKEVQ